MAKRTSEKLNGAISKLDFKVDGKPVFYWGWWWRDVDWDADSVLLAVSPSEARRLTGFCQNNKWGHPMFTVEGEQWTKLREMVEAVVDAHGSPESVAALGAYLVKITPAEGDMEKPGFE